jgi:hypothetical protein
LLLGLAVMVGIVHLVTIFAGGKITVAKNRVVAIWQHKRLKGKLQVSYHRLSKMVDDAESLYANYLRDVNDYNRGLTPEDRYLPVPLSQLVRHLIRHLVKDYHIPPGEEPGFDDDDDDLQPPRAIAA